MAVADGRPLGCASFTRARPRDGAEAQIVGLAHLSRMFVEPDHWGRGLGTMLLGHAHEEMRGRAYTAARLYTAAENARSRRFYERHGWLPGPEKRSWHGLLLIRYTLAVGQSPEPASAGVGAG